jgi:hypothetical protein
MKHLIIIGEGPTEQAFCRDVLYSHFLDKGILIHNPTIKTSKGGIVAWKVFKKELETHLKSSPNAIVTTLIDFYGLKGSHSFPLWEESKSKVRINERIEILEEGMKANLDESIRTRFIPYIQVYEFEALLFSDAAIFENSFEKSEFLDYDYLIQTLKINPEEINDGKLTAPSKRLERIIKGYKSEEENFKVFYGSLIAHDIGIEKIRQKCPRFNIWIDKLENI